jgi:NodT family efflux transporter outer membrane factor (OMF) lipoprotein
MIKKFICVAILALTLISSGCMIGPKYSRPPAPTPAAFHEAPPDGWKEAQPDDGKLKGKWWEIYNEPDLNALEEQVSISNQSVLAAEAQFRAARDAVRVARANLFPTVTAGTSITNSRTPSGTAANGAVASPSSIHTAYDLPVDFSYQADIWGSIRLSIVASAETAQVSAAQLENARLTYQAELAQDYFQLRTTRSDEELLAGTVKSYKEFLVLTQNRFAAGVASGADVAQAETQLYGTEAQLIDLEVARNQYEHAISLLTGKAPEAVPSSPLDAKAPPRIPIGIPSALLERRPDIAAAERQMAISNEQIGIAQVAYYPTVNLTASAGLTSTSFTQWLTWPSRFWTVGGSALETLFDAGKRRAQVSQAKNIYEVTIANYRQTVLVAFQQVEDNLSTLRVLENEAKVEADTVDAANRALEISVNQYKAGTNSYLQVITSQTAALQAQRTALDLLGRRMTTSVLLIEALGGGWDASSLPTVPSLTAKQP